MCPPPGQNRVKGPKYFTGTGTKTGAGNGWETRLGERLRPNESVNMYSYKTEGGNDHATYITEYQCERFTLIYKFTLLEIKFL